MCIYCGTNRYRKIYENHYGKIPKDETGRSYEIHHIDGDHSNNDPSNLKSVSIQEHYDIHYAQGDWGACHMIGRKMALTTDEISDVNRKIQNDRVAKGTHPFTGLQKKLVENGTHHFLGGEIQRRMVLDGTHPWTNKERARENTNKRVANGTHPFLGGEQSRRNNQTMLANGTHPSQIIKTCEHCGKTVSSSMYKRWHSDNCKLRK
jgi:hypothetical protein